MLVSAVMSHPVVSILPQDTLCEAAARMWRHDVGALPVLIGRSPVGMITDRDIVVRALSAAVDIGQRPVSAVMSANPIACFADQEVAEAAALMGDRQARRLLVMDRLGNLVGVLSIGDLAENVSEELAGQVLGEICEKRRPPGEHVRRR